MTQGKERKRCVTGEMKPVHSITLTVKGEKVYHAGKELDLSNGEVTELAMEFGKINDLPTIQIKAEGDVKVGTITDIKLQLREADALRLRYVTDGGDVSKYLPPQAKPGSDRPIVQALPGNMNRDDLINIKINEQGKVLMIANDDEYHISDVEDFDIEALKSMIINAENKAKLPGKVTRDIRMPDGSVWTATVSRAMILLEPNEETKQNAFVELEKKVRQAYTELREDLSMEKFSKKMNDLSAEERQVIYEAIPINVSEAEPKPKVII